MELQEKDEIILDTLKISSKKLKKVLIQQEIENLYQTFLKNKQQSGQDVLYFIPQKVLPFVVQSKTQNLNMKQIDKQNLLSFFDQNTLCRFNQFAHIQFTNLTILNLSKQRLHLLQVLGFVNAPKLRCLQLYDNQITNLNILVKADFPKLEVITFYHNPIKQIEKLCRYHSKRLTRYEFDNEISYQNRIEDYRFLFKMQNPKLKMLKVQDEKRINISKKKSYQILNQPGAKILIGRPRQRIPLRTLQREFSQMVD